MSIVAWNARGLGNPNTKRALKDTLIKYNPLITFLSETKKNQKYLERIKATNKFSGSFYVNPHGIAGGLALWWTENVSIKILRESVNFIDTLVLVNGEDPWQCTFVYGPPYTSEKQQFWANLQNFRHCSNVKWCIIGDINIVANQNDKDGGAPINKSHAQWFLDFMDVSGLIEVPIKGGMFTWSNLRCDNDAIAEKLDKILISSDWSLAFPKAIGVLEAAVASDHDPIILILDGMRKKRKKMFKFESRWLLEEECYTSVSEAWAGNPRQNAIIKIRDASNGWIEGEEEIFKEFQKHFQSLYTKDTNIDLDRLTDVIPLAITVDINNMLSREVTVEEIRKASPLCFVNLRLMMEMNVWY
ncbi:hypothetical protein V6N11_038049 [Hibiscus sabdariffa]|uniref:Endonuclease/exonuclease/phosphatase domain-containing protein n=1 Tax=Hibiscus sabdariffa TaxID=183260 RepID=A0ABR1ZIK7_9ROSI